MKQISVFTMIFSLACAFVTAQESMSRSVAVTIDVLPAVHSGDLDSLRVITRKLLDQLKANRVPAIGFVNEFKLAVAGEEAEHTALLDV